VTWNHNQKEATSFAAESCGPVEEPLVSFAAGRLGLQAGRGFPDATIHQVVGPPDDRVGDTTDACASQIALTRSLAALFRGGLGKPLLLPLRNPDQLSQRGHTTFVARHYRNP
jgi:hypothetical protein